MGKTILIVDDDPAQRRLLQAAVERNGFLTRAAENGSQAVQAVDTHADIDAVLLDLVMPGMSGQEALKEIRMRRGDLPCIVLTASGGIDTVVQAMQAGACDFFVKRGLVARDFDENDDRRRRRPVHRAAQHRPQRLAPFRALPALLHPREQERGRDNEPKPPLVGRPGEALRRSERLLRERLPSSPQAKTSDDRHVVELLGCRPADAPWG